MISVQKILTHIILTALIFTNSGYFVSADDIVLHNLDELPSVQEAQVPPITEVTPSVTEDALPLSELIREKVEFESTHTDIVEVTGEAPLSIIGSALAEEHEMYIAQTILALTPSTTPTLTPGFLVNPFLPGVSSSESIFSNFILGYESQKTETETIEKDGKKYAKKERKVAGTKGTISAKIPEGTIITTSEGETISESALDIVSLESDKKTKAKKKYEKKMKNRGNIKK